MKLGDWVQIKYNNKVRTIFHNCYGKLIKPSDFESWIVETYVSSKKGWYKLPFWEKRIELINEKDLPKDLILNYVQYKLTS